MRVYEDPKRVPMARLEATLRNGARDAFKPVATAEVAADMGGGRASLVTMDEVGRRPHVGIHSHEINGLEWCHAVHPLVWVLGGFALGLLLGRR